MDRVSITRGDRQVVTDFTTTVPVGSVVGLLGPSGCGKSTVMRGIVGVQAQVAGKITVFGHPAGDPRLRSLVGYRSQDVSLYEDLTVQENMEYFSELLGLQADQTRSLLETVQLASFRNQRVDRLSGGQRARLSLASALLNEPRLLVLDEPTVGLDPVLRRELWELFSDLAAAGTTLLVSSHVMDEAARCESLLLMRDGRLLAEGSPQELMRSTSSPTVEEAFLTLIEERGDSP
ncbi:MAG: ABC transporter ATP-binding protein [Acidimicrobiales bacterium]|nr:ABC transporter ATP-binding protein [Acidimicrobiales bacterium]